ncbi:MAG: UDP-N-acetylmuramoyl-tripeptide--D-alanyl-D-alanine ligase, partial [Chloroflexi bacterium]|nr:UDP-N-acetylmuramoyl-tripeptide--D-alanyl-D-alanine ligase [Chloroflexota bacterium]
MTDVDPAIPVPRSGAGPALTASDLARSTGGRLLARSDRPIRGAAVDSRLVTGDELFVALPGERTDGHAHLVEAVRRGASALVVTRPVDDPAVLGDVTVVRVADGVAALGEIASDWRRRFTPIVIGITGSIAKTSTKEAVAAVMAAVRPTLRSEGNQNNEIGLPLTLLRLTPEHEVAVLEMGMYVGGEIADLARIAQPSIGLVTTVQSVHLSRIGSLHAVEAAKGELLEALPPNGVAVLNADDPIVTRMDRRTAARVLRYGFAATADVRAEAVSAAGFDGMRFRLRTPVGGQEAVIPALGRLSVHNATAAAAVGIASGIPLDAIVGALAGGWSAPHRVQLVRLAGTTLVDDSYNASPGSVRAALELLGELPGRPVAVLGEMLELGDDHEASHRAVGRAAGATAELLVV